MIRICPYDFAEIENEKNIAYELVYSSDMEVEELKRDKDFAALADRVVRHNDDRRKIRFPGTFTAEAIDPSILLENGKRNGKSGLEILLKRIKKRESEQNKMDEALMQQVDRSYMEMDEDEKALSYYTDSDEDDFDVPDSDKKYIITEVETDKGMFTFKNPYKQVVMSALPCCPYCHLRLPEGWDKAEDFCAVSLMGPHGSGKTTMLLSLIANDWEKLSGFKINGKPLQITSAQREGFGGNYDELCKAAKTLVKNKKCPPETETNQWILPVFLQVDYDGHKLILGIYDNAGENLSNPDPIKKTFLRPLIDKTFADIYLFDPKDMLGVELRPQSFSESQKADVFEQSRIIEINEQGEFQKANSGKKVKGSELLDAVAHIDPEEKRDKDKTTLDVYNRIKKVRQAADCLEAMEEMYFVGVIIKSDLLEEMGRRDYGILFDRRTDGMTDINQMMGRSRMAVDMIKEFKLFGDKDVDAIGSEYGKDRTWHCISALGCDAQIHGELLGEYAPIRVAEPLITCIVRRLADNGWIH